MGFLLLLKFALLCIDFLAWPVIALGFPLFASIRAIETGSMYHMRKLVSYWTLFSLISLFEYVFVKIIEWIPFWSSIKLVAIFWLVIPRFHGAHYAFQSLVRPFLVVYLQQVINSFCKLKEEHTRGKERFLDVAEKYIQENGSEALEKLITSRVSYTMELRAPGNSQKDTQVKIESNEKYVAAAQKQLIETDAAPQKDKEMLEAHEITSPEAKQVPRPRLLTTTASCLPKETTYAAAKTEYKILTPPETLSSENRQPMTATCPLKKVKPEWHCPLCMVTCPCEIVFSSHLQGKKHLNKLKQVNTGPSSTANVDQNGSGDDTKQKQKSCQKPEEAVQKPDQLESWCDVCKLKLLSEVDVASHLKGKRHLSNIGKMAESGK